MQEAQEELAGKTVEVTAGGGKITVIANGAGDVLSIKISKDVVDPNDVEMLEDLVLTGVQKAIEEGRALMQAEMGKITGGMGMPPGLAQTNGIWNLPATPPTFAGCNSIGAIFFDGGTFQQGLHFSSTINSTGQTIFVVDGHISCEDIPTTAGNPDFDQPNNDFVMVPYYNSGRETQKRHPNEIEKDILCNLGYSFNTQSNGNLTWGANSFPSTATYIVRNTYQHNCSPPCEIVSVSDIYNIPNPTANTSLTIYPLANDINGAFGTLTQLVSLTPSAGTVSNQTTNSFIFSPSPGFTGWAVFSYIPTCGSGANAQLGGTSFIFVNIGYCDCPQPLVIGSPGMNTLLSGETNNITNAGANPCIRIEGNLIADVSFNFLNANIIMGTGAAIEINPAISISFQNSSLVSCTDMWKGICIWDNGELLTNNVTIKDAEYAVQFKSTSNSAIMSASLSAKNTSFIDNYVGIYLPKMPNATTPNTANIVIHDCTFKSINGLKQQ